MDVNTSISVETVIYVYTKYPYGRIYVHNSLVLVQSLRTHQKYSVKETVYMKQYIKNRAFKLFTAYFGKIIF